MLARISDDELDHLMRGYGHTPHVFVAGFDDEDHLSIHRRFAALLDEALDEIADIKARAAEHPDLERPMWPMIVLRTPKGWTCRPRSTASAPRTRGAPTRCRSRRRATPTST